MQPKLRAPAARLTRGQLREILAIACSGRPLPGALSADAYAPLAWLLRGDTGNEGVRGLRRSLYRKLVRDLGREFKLIYAERLASSNGPWDFPEVYRSNQRARKCIRRMQWCAWQHAFRLPGAGTASVRAYEQMLGLFDALAA